MSCMVSVRGEHGPRYQNMRSIHSFHDQEMERVDILMDLLLL